MAPRLEELERKRADIYRRLSLVGDFRRGTISQSYRKCGKNNCACSRPDPARARAALPLEQHQSGRAECGQERAHGA